MMYALGVALHGPSEHYPRPDAEGEPQCTRDRLDQHALAPCRHAHFLHCVPDALALWTTDGLLARGRLRLTAALYEILPPPPALSLRRVAVGSVQLDA